MTITLKGIRTLDKPSAEIPPSPTCGSTSPPVENERGDGDKPCRHCGLPASEHVKDSEPPLECPEDYQWGVVYGYYTGGDPRTFRPDEECCTPAEMENHRRACQIWNEWSQIGAPPEPEACPSGWLFDDDGNPVAHVLRAPYGIGTQEYLTFYQP